MATNLTDLCHQLRKNPMISILTTREAADVIDRLQDEVVRLRARVAELENPARILGDQTKCVGQATDTTI